LIPQTPVWERASGKLLFRELAARETEFRKRAFPKRSLETRRSGGSLPPEFPVFANLRFFFFRFRFSSGFVNRGTTGSLISLKNSRGPRAHGVHRGILFGLFARRELLMFARITKPFRPYLLAVPATALVLLAGSTPRVQAAVSITITLETHETLSQP